MSDRALTTRWRESPMRAFAPSCRAGVDALTDWIPRTIGGVAPAAPGYSTVLIAPQPGGEITEAQTVLQ